MLINLCLSSSNNKFNHAIPTTVSAPLISALHLPHFFQTTFSLQWPISSYQSYVTQFSSFLFADAPFGISLARTVSRGSKATHCLCASTRLLSTIHFARRPDGGASECGKINVVQPCNPTLYRSGESACSFAASSSESTSFTITLYESTLRHMKQNNFFQSSNSRSLH